MGNNCEFSISDIVNETNKFRNILKESYKTKYATITLIDQNSKKSIEDIFVNLSIIKEEQKEKEQKEDSDLRDRYMYQFENIYRAKEPVDVAEIVTKATSHNYSRSVIFGKPGVGKTTLCKYIAYNWAIDKLYTEFDLLIYIPLRRYSKDIKNSIKDIYQEIDLDIPTNNKTLLLLDGYDELSNDDKSRLNTELKEQKFNNYIVTTRPYGYAKGAIDINKEFETVGFTNENIELYIEKFFTDNPNKADRLKSYIKNSQNINQIAHIPIMLTIICILYKKDNIYDTTLSISDFYSQIIYKFLVDYHEKDRANPRVFDSDNQEKLKEILGKIAFEGIKEFRIEFDKDYIDKIISKKDKKFLKRTGVHAGLLKTETKSTDLYNNKFEFIHLSFQEYFAAVYVSKLYPKKSQQLKKIIKQYKFYPHMQIFFVFLAGVIENKEFLIQEIQNRPRDIFLLYETILILDLLSEIKKMSSHKRL